MTEPKLKRSPYLSQMTRTADADLMASLSRPSEGSGGSHAEGVSMNFFELRRPAGASVPKARPGQQKQSLRSSLRQVKSTSDPNNSIRKAASVTFCNKDPKASASQATLISSSSGEVSISTSIRNMSLTGSEHSTTCEQPQEPPKPAPLQYYYNPSMRSCAMSLDANNRPPLRSTTFQDMLDEGDGKEGDLNQRFRNERWKAFDCLHAAPNKKRRGEAMSRSNGVVSANDLALMRRSASRMQMNTNSTFAALSKSGSALSLSRHPLLNQSISTNEPQELASTNTEALKRSYTESVLETRVGSISAGLAYGSEHIRMLNPCKNC